MLLQQQSTLLFWGGNQGGMKQGEGHLDDVTIEMYRYKLIPTDVLIFERNFPAPSALASCLLSSASILKTEKLPLW